MKKWFIGLFNRESSRQISVGSRVHTKFGVGTVVSGSITVKYDPSVNLKFPGKKQDPNNRSWTHNLDENGLI